MVFAFISLLLAQIVCVDNGDGTWTCRGEGYPGVTTNDTGGTVCTNCVNMSPADCQSKRQALINLGNEIQNLSDTLGYAFQDTIGFTYGQISLYQSFTDFPWGFDFSNSSPNAGVSIVREILGDSSAAFNVNNANQSASIVYTAFNLSPQVASNFISSVSSKTFTSGNFITGFPVYVWDIASLWHGSYQMGQSALAALRSIYGDLLTEQNLNQQILFKSYDVISRAESITCEPCQLSAGDGGGGSGVQTGCLECYLVFLRRYQEQLDHLNDQTAATTNILYQILGSVNSALGYLPSISNHVARIDDYLWTDQSNKLANVESAIIVISNNIDSIQKYYYHTFSNASDISSGVYYDPQDGHPQDFEQVVSNVFYSPRGFDLDFYQKFSWFERVEMLLAEISGVLSPGIADSPVSDSQYEDIVSNARGLNELAGDIDSSGESVETVGQSLVALGRSIGGIFNTGSSSMVLIENWIGGDALVLTPDNTVVQGCRVVFSLIWSVLACVVMWRLLVSAWYVVVDVARWFCNWFPKIYGN